MVCGVKDVKERTKVAPTEPALKVVSVMCVASKSVLFGGAQQKLWRPEERQAPKQGKPIYSIAQCNKD